MADTPPTPLPPGSTIGILGSGQLGRMTAMAAARLGYRCHVFDPVPDGPAAQVCDAATTAAYDDMDALKAFADAVDVVTFEFENVPAETADALAARVPVRPNARALAISQDRAREKDFLVSIDVATAPYAEIEDFSDLADAIGRIGCPAVLKTARFGYDGKGQERIDDPGDANPAWHEVDQQRAILEGFIAFDLEISVIVARGVDGSTAAYVPVENRHVDHILDTTIAPAPVSDSIADSARDIAKRIAVTLDYVGLLGVEMFVTAEGDLLVNEIAPRPHNSGHWTIDACAISQFEQFVRAVCGLPLGSPERHSDAVMKNLIGDAVDAWPDLLAEPGTNLHLYGKAEARPGRKMGHVTRLYPKGSLDGEPV